jgi:hypothetical protein
LIQPGVTEHYLGRVSPFGDPWISARSGSPRHFVACHVLHRLLAPRHPPRALCSLTSLSSSPNGKCQGTIGVYHLVIFYGEIEVIRLTADHVFTWKGSCALAGRPPRRRTEGPAIRWWVISNNGARGHSSGDRCCSRTHGRLPGTTGGLVETRRLELLTLSLQRRCSSS